MNDRKKKSFIIIVLCIVLVIMAVGYAVFTRMFSTIGDAKITGEWNIYVYSINVKNEHGSGKSKINKINSDRLSVNFEADLGQPTDYVEYDIVVKNDGVMDAELSSATLIPENPHEYVIYSNTAIPGTILNSKEQMIFTIKVEFKNIEGTFEIEDTIRAISKLQLNFTQKQNN